MAQDPKKEAAMRTDSVRLLDANMRHSWWRLGEEVSIVHTKNLWKFLNNKSFGSWLDENVPTSRRTAYDAMNVWVALREIKTALRIKIPKQNAKQLATLSESKRRSKKWIDMAIKMKENDFKAAIKAQQEGAEREETTVTKHFHFAKSQWQIVETAMEAVKEDAPEDVRPHGLITALAASYLLIRGNDGQKVSKCNVKS